MSAILSGRLRVGTGDWRCMVCCRRSVRKWKVLCLRYQARDPAESRTIADGIRSTTTHDLLKEATHWGSVFDTRQAKRGRCFLPLPRSAARRALFVRCRPPLVQPTGLERLDRPGQTGHRHRPGSSTHGTNPTAPSSRRQAHRIGSN